MASIDKRIVSEKVADVAVKTSEFPQLRLPNRDIADSGVVRLGNGTITANFPAKSVRK